MPKSPSDFAALASADTVGSVLGIEVTEATPERCVATMPIDARHHQPFGYLHGGVSVVLAETVASVGAYMAAPEGYTSFGQEINANHLRPKRSGTLTAVGTPVYIGRSSQVWAVEITDERGKMICISRCTLAVVPLRGEGGKGKGEGEANP